MSGMMSKYWYSQEDGTIYMPGDQPNPYDDSLIEIQEKEALMMLRTQYNRAHQESSNMLRKITDQLRQVCDHKNSRVLPSNVVGEIRPYFECYDCGLWWSKEDDNK